MSSTSASMGPTVAQPHLLDWLWSIPLLTAGAAFLSTVGVSNYGFFYVVYMEHYRISREEASWPASTHCIVSHVIGLILAVLQKRMSIYSITLIGGIFSWMGFVLSAFAPNIETMSVTMGAVYAIGSGTMVIMLSVYNATYFEKYRGVATGFKFVGWSLSGLTFPPILSYLFDGYGFQGGMLLCGAIVMNVMIFILLLERPRPVYCCSCGRRKLSRQPLLLQPSTGNGAGNAPKLSNQLVVKVNDEVKKELNDSRGSFWQSVCSAFTPLQAPIFYAFLPAFALSDYGDMVLSTIIVDYAVDKGWRVKPAKSLIMCISLAGLVGKLLLPLAADRGHLSRSALVALCYLVIALALMSLPHVSSFVAVWLVCFAAAAPFGCMLTMKGVLVADYLGIEHIPASMGITGVAMLPLLLGNPAIVGFFRDHMGSYDNLFRFIAALAILVAATLLGLVCHERADHKKRRLDNSAAQVGCYGSTI
ncbi:monocarboxylate transporter 14-like [Amblyomma americanum]